MIYTLIAMTFLIATGIVLSRYELYKRRRERSERLRQRLRRCVRRGDN